jgi:LysM domain
MRSIERAFEGMTGMATTTAATAATAATAGTAATLRLTRRGRLVLVMAVMLLAVLAGLTLGHGSSLAASRAPASHAMRHTVIVAPGETLWAVASRVAPHDDPRLVVATIESINHLRGSTVQAGQQLVVPTRG